MLEIVEIKQKKSRKIPPMLIRETLRGKDLYYKGYKDVLSKQKQPEEIMGCSSLQSILVSIIEFFIQSKINRRKYWVTGNEAGLHLGHNNNLSTDLGIFLKGDVVLNEKYFDVAPLVSIEVDVKIDVKNMPEMLEYIFGKGEEMINFGSEKIIWILTKPRKVFVMQKNEPTKVIDWKTDIEVIDGIILNLTELLSEEGVMI